MDIFVISVKEHPEKEIIVFKEIYDYLKTKGYTEWTGQWLVIEGIPVEFIPAGGLAKEAVENAIETKFEGVQTKIISPEYLILLFLKAFREKDKIKIQLLLQQAEINMENLKNLLNRYN